MQFPENVKKIINRLETAGFEAYAVGGCVRDSLLGLTPPDYDIATSAFPDEIKEVFKDYKTVDIGAKHGTIAVITDDGKIEVTTFRTDGDYSDSRRPDSVVFTKDLKSDLSRRDFTVNAMAFSEKTGIIDLFGGKKDLRDRVLRAVREPEKRFTEDALRIMRALRFMSELGFSCETETGKYLRKLKDKLLLIAPERISAELDKLLTGDYTESIILEYYDVLGVIIPELIDCAGFDQQSKYHVYDVLSHIAKTVSNSPKERVLRLTMLFHDIAKPCCFSFEPSVGAGKFGDAPAGHFYGHQKKSAEIAENTMRRLRYDNAATAKVKLLIENHDRELKTDDVSVKRLLNKFGFETLRQLCDVQVADAGAKSELARGEDKVGTLRLVMEKAIEIIEKEQCFSLSQLAVNGNDLIERGFKGAEIGRVLQDLLEKVISGEVPNDKQALLEIVEKAR